MFPIFVPLRWRFSLGFGHHGLNLQSNLMGQQQQQQQQQQQANPQVGPKTRKSQNKAQYFKQKLPLSKQKLSRNDRIQQPKQSSN